MSAIGLHMQVCMSSPICCPFPPPSRADCHLQTGGNGTTCNVTLNIPRRMRAPVFMYYQLNNFYQNHRRWAVLCFPAGAQIAIKAVWPHIMAARSRWPFAVWRGKGLIIAQMSIVHLRCKCVDQGNNLLFETAIMMTSFCCSRTWLRYLLRQATTHHAVWVLMLQLGLFVTWTPCHRPSSTT